jgi:general secretion pathway protein D
MNNQKLKSITSVLSTMRAIVMVPMLALALAGPMPVWAQQEHILNLKDAEVSTLIATVAEITGDTFVVDPRVQGKVTVISSQAMDEKGIYDLFLSVLRVHGFAAVKEGDTIRILPDVEARQQKNDLALDGNPDDLITKVIPLQHVQAQEVVNLVRPLLPQQSHLAAHVGSNSLLIADRAGNVARIERVVQRIDRRNDQSIEVIALQNASASEVVRTLRLLEPQQEGSGEQVIADERTNSILLSADPSKRLKLRTLIYHLDTPLENSGSTQVVHLNYADAASLVGILEAVTQNVQTADADGEPSVGVRIQAHPETNSLVITASAAEFRTLQSVIRSLDIPRAQVHVEAIIAEVSVDTVRELGVQWQATGSLDPILDADGNVIGLDSGFFGGTSFGANGTNIINLASGASAPSNGLNIGYVSGTTEILGNEVLQLGAVLRALRSDADTNILSTPSVVTLDNQEASIQVGQEVPFVTGQFTNSSINNSDGQVNPFQTINREEVGIKLTVTPKINEGDAVILNINQEVSSLAPIAGAVDLITNKRTLTTTVMVPDNAILVLGGLITDDLQETIERVPGLSSIPLIGEAFKFRSTQRVKRNLMIFIRPRILKDRLTLDTLSAGKYDFIRSQQILKRETSDSITPEDEMPLLPELYDYLQLPAGDEQ